MGQREWAAAPGLTQNGDGRWEWGPDPNWDLWGGLWGPMGTAGGEQGSGAGPRQETWAGRGGLGGAADVGRQRGAFGGGVEHLPPAKGSPWGRTSALCGAAAVTTMPVTTVTTVAVTAVTRGSAQQLLPQCCQRVPGRGMGQSLSTQSRAGGAPRHGGPPGSPPPPPAWPWGPFVSPTHPQGPIVSPLPPSQPGPEGPLMSPTPPPHRQGSPRVTPPPPPGVPLSPPTPSLALRVPHVMAPHL